MPKKRKSPADGQVFHVGPELAEQTLGAVLRQWLPEKSWSQIRRCVQGRQVMVSGNLCLDAGRRLTERDVVKVLPHSAAPLPKADDVRIVFLDAQVVVVDKPSGMTSIRHAEEQDWPSRRKQIQPTLDEALPRILGRKKAGAAAKGREGKKSSVLPVRAVHRLDRETSGLLVFARTVPAERALGLQFRGHTTHRRYLAVVQGRVEARTIESQLVRDRGDGRRGSTKLANVGKHAVTHVRPIEHFDGYTLIECRLETGRTHQIRIHLSELGHPVCGDKLYHQPLFGKLIADRSGAPRLALHAAELGFQHPATQEMVSFKSPLPADLAKFIDRLRKAKPSTDRE